MCGTRSKHDVSEIISPGCIKIQSSVERCSAPLPTCWWAGWEVIEFFCPHFRLVLFFSYWKNRECENERCSILTTLGVPLLPALLASSLERSFCSVSPGTGVSRCNTQYWRGGGYWYLRSTTNQITPLPSMEIGWISVWLSQLSQILYLQTPDFFFKTDSKRYLRTITEFEV